MTEPKVFTITEDDAMSSHFSGILLQWMEDPVTRIQPFVLVRKQGEERAFKLLQRIVRRQFGQVFADGDFRADLPIQHGEVRVIFTVEGKEDRITFTPRMR